MGTRPRLHRLALLGLGSLIICGVLTATFLAGRTTASKVEKGPAANVSAESVPAPTLSGPRMTYGDFVDVASRYQQQFRPEGFRIIHPTAGLTNSVTFFPKMKFDTRGIDALNGDPRHPTRFDLFYLSDNGVLVQLSLVYAPWSTESQVISWSALRNGLTHDFPAEYQPQFDLPYALEGLIGQPGYLVRLIALPTKRTIPENDAAKLVAVAHESLVAGLDRFMSGPHTATS